MHNLWRRISTISWNVAFVVCGLELLFRLAFSDPEYYWRYRLSFISSKAFENKSEGLWTYRPHTAIREVAVYAVALPYPFKTDLVVESDCRMKSNNLGLLQRDDIEAGTNATVIVGDSFTEGQGGCPWFDRLQSRRKTDRLVNGGLMGTGVEQWRRLVDYLQESGIKLKRLLVIAISDDFKRGAWNWGDTQLACLDDGKCSQALDANLWLPLAGEESQPALLARAVPVFAKRFPDDGWLAWLGMFLEQRSHLYKFVDRGVRAVRGLVTKPTHPVGILSENVAALLSLKRIGVPFQVLMVPQRGEINLLGEHPDSDAAVEVLKAHSIPYRWCHLSEDDFMPYDGHPNRGGYEKIAACADEALGRLEESGHGPVTLR